MTRAAVSGAGYAADYLVKALTELEIPVVGIANRTRERGVRLAEKAGAVFYENLDDLIKETHPGILVIATATESHVRDVKTAVENGVQRIFCEKPAGIDVSETQAIARICEEYHAIIGIGYKMRYESIFKLAKERVNDGRIGKLSVIAMDFFQTVPHSPWYLDSGFIRETLVHPMDLSNWITGDVPVQVSCVSENHLGGKGEDRVFAVIRYESGITAQITGGWIPNYPYIPGRRNICFQLVGTGGYICGVRPDKLLLCDETGPQRIDVYAADPIKLELQDFIERTEKGRPINVGISDAIKVQSIIEGVRRSAISGRVVNL